MGGDSSFNAMLRISAFLMAIWTATWISKRLKVSSVLFEITTGVVLGPDLVGLINPEYSQCEHSKYTECGDPMDDAYLTSLGGMTYDELALHHPALVVDHVQKACYRRDYYQHDRNGTDASDDYEHDRNGTDELQTSAGDDHSRKLAGKVTYASYEECLVRSCAKELNGQCQRTPDIFTLIGHVGVGLMIFESGMHFDFDKAKSVGPWACLVATLGTILPLAAGTATAVAYGSRLMPAIVAGTALAPTSVGMSLKLLTETKMLDNDFGQTIMTAAFVDDILSLILFNIIFSMGTGKVDFMHTFFPSIMGISFMVIAVLLAIFLWPWLLKDVMAPGVRKMAHNPHKIPIEDEAILFIMLLVLASYAVITAFCGTHLWGCFIAGMSFACLGHDVFDAHHLWAKQTKRITSWMLRIFFACTVAFSIPVTELLSFDAFWRGSIMGIGPCIATKVFCAFFMGESRWVIGWAMVGRAEFAYLIAQMGLAGGMMDQKLFSIVIWALLWATVFAPLVFTRVLRQFIRNNASCLSQNTARDVEQGAVGRGVQLDNVAIDISEASSEGSVHEAAPAERKALDAPTLLTEVQNICEGKAYASAHPIADAPTPDQAGNSEGPEVETSTPQHSV